MGQQTDVIVVGGGLAGLVAATELADAGKRVTVVDQEGEQNLGGQAFWSFGGLFLVDSPEQRRMGIKDSHALALEDWMGTAAFDREEDHWPRKWAEAFVDFAATEMRPWLHAQGMRWFPVVGWAERGGYGAVGHGNSVPRFHVTWGTGPGVLAPFVRRAQAAREKGTLTFLFRHRVDELLVEAGAVVGVRGMKLVPSDVERGVSSSRETAGDFELRGSAVVVTSGGIGGNHELVRKSWPERMGPVPKFMVQGVPAHVDGRMIAITEAAGGRLINRDRMWHYTEGLRNWNPIWPRHGIRILPGPSSLWLDATGKRLPPPLFPGFDTLGTLEHILKTGHEYSWFVLNQWILKKEFALSGSEQNPDLTGKDWKGVLNRAVGKKAMGPVEAFKEHGADFVVANDLRTLVEGMNAKTETPVLDFATVEREVLARDRQLDNPFGKDLQIAAIRQARGYRGDQLVRTAKLHRILDPKAGPLIGVKLNVLTRKTLGGFETDLSGRVFGTQGQVIPGLYAAGEVAGFGGGGVHGYRALEGTFLGGCIFSGRAAGRALVKTV
ncbi:FAD-binding dehydrogenase [Myxococcus llanfairpwllgwyngyllgogerychwyrndrobwllllantysiliogogogochensis]|uniref:FAD-binding dehydrogenase n=2 Tax=Myxococcus TaxID=32 RepID=A0A540WRF2_9BACT|nr:FAD-binding dehydrogenase [Myxococcus llanfairpwllgwyngyllgogerychwyrndrobwllllantysiliogogogochensis]TQF11487.1 FAD-binding dehydrogenase [Myxococcus llanfairpwllgwyngyllgogerychwyrndrobwllllantysiliogogogochensis]